MAQAEIATGIAECESFVAGAVVGHDARDGDAEAFVIGDGGPEEGDRAESRLVRLHLDEGQPRGIVDADMSELPARPDASAAAAIPGDAMPGFTETVELLDVDMDQFAWPGTFVAAHWLARVEVAHPAQPRPPQDSADRGRRDIGLPGDRLATQPLAPQRDDLLDFGPGRRAMQPMRP